MYFITYPLSVIISIPNIYYQKVLRWLPPHVTSSQIPIMISCFAATSVTSREFLTLTKAPNLSKATNNNSSETFSKNFPVVKLLYQFRILSTSVSSFNNDTRSSHVGFHGRF